MKYGIWVDKVFGDGVWLANPYFTDDSPMLFTDRSEAQILASNLDAQAMLPNTYVVREYKEEA